VKIDGAVLGSIPDEAEKAALVHALVALCASLGITATAENVESEDDLRLLSSRQCAEAQGPALGRALAGPEDNAARLLAMNSELA